MLAYANFKMTPNKDAGHLSLQQNDKNASLGTRLSSLGMSAGAKGDDNDGMDSFRAYGQEPTIRLNQEGYKGGHVPQQVPHKIINMGQIN